MNTSKSDMLDVLGEHKLSFMFFTCICLTIAIYCFNTAGASSFGDTCRYGFQCADLYQYDLICHPVLEEERCVILENENGECPDHTRHEDGACLPIEGIRTTIHGDDRVAPSIHGGGPSSALGEGD